MRFVFQSQLSRIAIQCWVGWIYLVLKYRLSRYKEEQTMLAQRYEITNSKIETYSDAMRVRISDLASHCQGNKNFAWTSGTMSKPKQIFYPKYRLQELQKTYIEQVVLAYSYLGLKRPAFYFFTSMSADNSVSNLLCKEMLPKILENWILSDSIVYVPEIAQLTGKYRQEILHLAMLLLSQPSLLATANPSSIYILVEKVRTNWASARQEIAEVLKESGVVEVLRKKLGSNVDLRLQQAKQLVDKTQAPQIQELFPELKVIYCWDGGYVQPFIDNVKSQFAPIALKFFPMFSLSTETVSYLIYPLVSIEGGLPLYPGICYEFLPIDFINEENVLKPWELNVGHQYTMLVSDAYGLKRYHTEDIFECLHFNNNTPVLRFIGRIGINYSFTGEKITDKQLLQTYASVRGVVKIPEMALTCFPKLNQGNIPGYVFVCIADETRAGNISAEMIDQFLMEINQEYASKRKSSRLAKPELVIQNYKQFVDKLRNYNHCSVGTSFAQFKILPLYKMFWEDVNQERSSFHE